MIQMLRTAMDALLGRGEYSVTIPVMDGPFQPNQALQEAPVVATVPDLDNLVATPTGVYFSSGHRLMKLSHDGAESMEMARFEAPISCIAHDGADMFAIGIDGVGVRLHGGRRDGHLVDRVGERPLRCPTAAVFIEPERLVVCNGSSEFPAARWKHDLVSLGRTGFVCELALRDGGAGLIADRLGFPYGVAPGEDGRLFVSEAWRHRVLKVTAGTGAAPQSVLTDLPGYPARISPANDGGYWLTLFAARNQLYEFVLREREYCRRMMAEVDAEWWLAPAYTSGKSFKEQLQGDSVKQMGVLKPWAPPRSYGLVVLCDHHLQPVASWHSRADGSVHAVTSACEADGALLVGARGPGQIVRMPLVGLTAGEPF